MKSILSLFVILVSIYQQNKNHPVALFYIMKKTLFFIIMVLIFGGNYLYGQGLALPTLEGLEFSPSTVNVSDNPANVIIKLHLKGEISNTINITFSFNRIPGGRISCNDFRLVSGTYNDGIYEDTLVVPQNSQNGDWWINLIFIGNWGGGAFGIDYSDLQSKGFPTILHVESTTSDTEPPQILGLDISPSSVDVSSSTADVKFTLHMKDTQNDITDVQVFLYAPSGGSGTRRYNTATLSSGTLKDGIFECTITIPQYGESGYWYIGFIYVKDHVSNWTKYFTADLQALGLPKTVNVQSSISDWETPILQSFTLAPEVVDITKGAANIKLTAHITDDLTGTSDPLVRITPPPSYTAHIDNNIDLLLVSGTDKDGIYEGYFQVPLNNSIGEWIVNWIFLRDQIGHFGYTDLSNSAFPHTITVLDKISTPVLQSPANNATNQPISLTLSWNAVTGASAYHMQVSTNEQFSEVIAEDSTITGTSKTLEGLLYNKKYYWRVSAKNILGTGEYSTVWNFTTIIPAISAPELLSPTNNSINQQTSLNLEWNSVQYAEKYYLQVSTDNLFSSFVFNDSLIGTSKVLNGLLYNTRYYWRVKANTSFGFTLYSQVWNFNTIVPLPASPVLVSPSNNTVDLPINFDIRWNEVPNAERYILQIAFDSLFTNILSENQNVHGTSYGFSNFAFYKTKFYWRVRAANVNGTGPFSPVWNFTIMSAPQFTLQLNRTGTGAGQIKVNNAVQTLPYSGSFNSGILVNLEAVPSEGSDFTGWEGDLTGTTNPASILVNGNKTIASKFTLKKFSLTINKTGDGTGQVKVNSVTQTLPYSNTFDYGTTVNIEAVPDVGFNFAGWEGDFAGNTNPVTVTITGNKTISSKFTINKFSLTINKTGTGTGNIKVNSIVQTLPYSGLFDSGATVNIEAIPDEGSGFTAWENDLTGTSNPATITINGNKTISSKFTIKKFSLTIYKTGDGTGQVKVNNISQTLPYSGTFDYGTAVNLEAVPDGQFNFTEWEGDLTGTTNPTTITINENKIVSSKFLLKKFSLTINKIGSGLGLIKVNSVSQTLPYSGSFDYGTIVSLEAVPDSGNNFIGWEGDLTGTTNPASVTINGNKTIISLFGKRTYSLNINKGGAGDGQVKVNDTLRVLPYSGFFIFGSVVKLEAVPVYGSNFTNWEGALNGNANPDTLRITDVATVNAIFEKGKFSLSITKSGTGDGQVKVNGAAQALPYTGIFTAGEVVNLEAVATTGSLFTSWENRLTGNTNPDVLIIDSNKTVNVVFDKQKYSLAINKEGTGNGQVKVNGIEQLLPYSKTFDYGTVVNVEAVPSTGSNFTSWAGDLSISTNPTTITVDGNKTVKAIFEKGKYSLTVQKSGTGDGQIKVGGIKQTLPFNEIYDYGTTINIEADPASGNVFTRWEDGLTGSNNPETITIDGNKLVKAVFTYSLPETPILLSPSNDTLHQPGNITFRWNQSLRAEKYILQGSKSPDFSIVNFGADEILGTQKNIDGLELNTRYYWHIKAKNSLGESAWSEIWNFTTEYFIQAPSDLIAFSLEAGSVNLEWYDNSSNEDGYIIERADSNLGNFIQITNVTTGVHNHVDNMVGENRKYLYRVKAYNLNTQSEYSNLYEVLTPISDLEPPANLIVEADSSGDVVLTWDDNSDNEDGFIVERESNGGGSFTKTNGLTKLSSVMGVWIPIDTLDANTTQFVDENVQEGQTYQYRVYGFNDQGISPTLVDTAAQPFMPLIAPDNLEVKLTDKSKVHLSWHDNSDYEAGFLILRRKDEDLSFTSIDSVIANTVEYTDTTFEAGSIYFYTICAYNEASISAYCNEQQISTSVGINEDDLNNLTFRLFQNYPNPFNPSTTIDFEISKSDKVKILIYNIIGSVVRELYNKETIKGKYSITWDGKDNSGNNVSSGTYFYQIQSVESIQVKKMILLK